MNRIGIIIRNIFLGLVTVGILAALIAADWYVRYDPTRKARRLLEAQQTPLNSASAVVAAAEGDIFNLEQLDLAQVDLSSPDSGSGMTPLLAAIRFGQTEATNLLLSKDSVLKTIDLPAQDDENESALSLALERNDFGLAKKLIRLGADVDVRFESHEPMLVHALQIENWALFDFLLENQADPNAQDPDGLPLLAMAIENQDGERIGRLLEVKADVNVNGRSGDPLLMEAVGRGDEDFADQLLKHGAEPNRAGASGQTALFAAVSSGRTAMTKLLLENGADPNLAPQKRPTPLEIATESQDADLMQVLIEAGADVKSSRLMMTAFDNRDLSGMTTLLRAGADPEVSIGNGKTILDVALADQSENIAQTLLEAGASAKGKLWSALGTGNEELINMVLRHGASVSERDPERGLPLDYALEQGNATFVATMLAYGANPNVKRKDGESWIAAGIRQGNEDVVDALLDHGACTEGLTSADGQSLLNWAIAHDMTKVAKRLIEEGADVRGYVSAPASDEFTAAFSRSKTFRWHLQSDSKLNPLHLAAAKGNVEIAQALIEAGAKKGDCSRRYLWPVNIAAWHMDVPMMQVILGRDPDPDKQPRKVIVDLGSQRATLYEGGKSVYSTQVSTGKSGYRTPTGVYVITDKHRHHNSTLYGSSMPYFMRLSCAAFGLHQGHVPNYPASHGCIRVPYSGAKHLFSVCEVGDVVEITH